jgi:fucose 4-O-acetylase-like acetyltransferase
MIKRDRHVDIMLFWGIIFVVMGHNYEIPYVFFPAYSFHIGLFFFISGYLFKIRLGLLEKLQFIKKKITTQLIPYYIFNAIFFTYTFFLAKNNYIGLSHDFNLYSFFVEPFIFGHQNVFVIPLWFILTLFLVNIIMQLIYLTESKKYKWLIFLLILAFSSFMLHKGLEPNRGPILIVYKLAFALIFFQIGHFVKTYKTKFDAIVLKPINIVIMWILVVLIENNAAPIAYSIAEGNLQNPNIFIPLMTTFIIICISYAICHFISINLKQNSIFEKIGQNSFWIMALHLCIFFNVNLLFYLLGYVENTAITDIYFRYEIDKTFLIYQIPAVFLPVLLGEFFRRNLTKKQSN